MKEETVIQYIKTCFESGNVDMETLAQSTGLSLYELSEYYKKYKEEQLKNSTYKNNISDSIDIDELENSNVRIR